MKFIRIRGKVIPIGNKIPKLVNATMAKTAAKASLNHIEKKAFSKYGIKLISSVSRLKPNIKIDTLIVPRGIRKQGFGSDIMKKIGLIADKNKLHVSLDVAGRDSFSGTTSANRLIKFYRRFGFKPNVGRNSDFRFNEYMVRRPKK
jgi:predicted GNAT family acetyltransferase